MTLVLAPLGWGGRPWSPTHPALSPCPTGTSGWLCLEFLPLRCLPGFLTMLSCGHLKGKAPCVPVPPPAVAAAHLLLSYALPPTPAPHCHPHTGRLARALLGPSLQTQGHLMPCPGPFWCLLWLLTLLVSQRSNVCAPLCAQSPPGHRLDFPSQHPLSIPIFLSLVSALGLLSRLTRDPEPPRTCPSWVPMTLCRITTQPEARPPSTTCCGTELPPLCTPSRDEPSAQQVARAWAAQQVARVGSRLRHFRTPGPWRAT